MLAIGIAVAATAPAAHIEHGPIALGSLARYAAQATGVALALRAVALLLATFSMSLLVHRFNVSLMGVLLTTIACLSESPDATAKLEREASNYALVLREVALSEVQTAEAVNLVLAHLQIVQEGLGSSSKGPLH